MEVFSTVRKDPDGNEVLRFEFDDPIDVALTDESGVNDLKRVFRKILQLLVTENVTVKFERDKNMPNDLFAQACEEYVKSLDDEIKAARDDMIRKGLAGPV